MFEDVPALRAATFFKLSFPLPRSDRLDAKKGLKKPFLLPDISEFLDEDSFARVAMAWNEKGLFVVVDVDKAFEESAFPELQRGDSFELFIDTRDLKSAGTVTRFCHHFVFFPKEDDECKSQEITRMREEDSRELADPDDLSVDTTFNRKSYTMEIAISNDALYGYSPKEFNRLGICYSVNRKGGDPQSFAVSSHEYAFSKHPALWATGELV
ncbi:MAG: hypothetical protein KDK50_01580 [Chlamydiia bacterium]|nr:hypothetical protein [Chlamydiia bacterium]